MTYICVVDCGVMWCCVLECVSIVLDKALESL